MSHVGTNPRCYNAFGVLRNALESMRFLCVFSPVSCILFDNRRNPCICWFLWQGRPSKTTTFFMHFGGNLRKSCIVCSGICFCLLCLLRVIGLVAALVGSATSALQTAKALQRRPCSHSKEPASQPRNRHRPASSAPQSVTGTVFNPYPAIFRQKLN